MLTAFDKKLLNEVQIDFPIAAHPFAEIASRLDSDEETVIRRLRELESMGYIRRFGAFFDSHALGYKGTLVAVRVEKEMLPEVAEFINGFAGVTHNYEREGEYNLWFTLLTDKEEEKAAILQQVADLPGVEKLLDLVSEKTYKVRVKFCLQ